MTTTTQKRKKKPGMLFSAALSNEWRRVPVHAKVLGIIVRCLRVLSAVDFPGALSRCDVRSDSMLSILGILHRTGLFFKNGSTHLSLESMWTLSYIAEYITIYDKLPSFCWETSQLLLRSFLASAEKLPSSCWEASKLLLILGSSDSRILGYSDFRIFGFSDSRILGFSEHLIIWLSYDLINWKSIFFFLFKIIYKYDSEHKNHFVS